MGTPSEPATADRQLMIEQHIRRRGVRCPAVLDAMRRVPREQFVPEPLREVAYEDRALEIGSGQTISQPFMVAHMTEQLALQPEHRVLEVGTGSGYQTAILSLLCRSVYTVETVAPLAEAARARLQRLDVANCHFHTGDGTLGWPQQAPFDRIIVTAGASRIPQPLVEQLVIGGVMILPLGGQREQRLTRIERRAGRTIEWPGLGCRFVKLIGRHSWPQDQDEHNTN